MSAKKQKVQLKEGDLVFAKVRGHPHWPARISSVADLKGYRFHVFFYGTYETAICKKEDLVHFNAETKEKYWKQTRKGFLEGLYEIENTPDIAVQVDSVPLADVSQTDESLTATPEVTLKKGKKRKQEDESSPAKTPVPTTEAATPVTGKNTSLGKSSKTPKSATTTPSTAPKTPAANIGSKSKSTKIEVSDTPKTTPKASKLSKGEMNTPKTGSKITKTPVTTLKEGSNAKSTNDAKSKSVETQPRKTASKKATETPKIEAVSTPAEAASTSKRLKKTPKMETTPAAVHKSKTETQICALAATPSKTPITSQVESPSDVEKVSRSGRIIKPKKFDDDKPQTSAAATPNKPEVATCAEKSRMVKKIWVTVLSTGDVVEIDVDQGRPQKFDSKAAESRWLMARRNQVQILRQKIESGEFIPEEIRVKNEHKMAIGDDKLAKEKQISSRQEKIRWLKLEQNLVEVNYELRLAAHHLHPDIKRSLELLGELHKLTVGEFVIKKHPEVVETVRKLRKYVGPQNLSADELKVLKDQIEKIRLKANSIYVKIKSSFAMPDDSDVVETLNANQIDVVRALEQFRDVKATGEIEGPTSRKQRRLTK